MHSCCTNIGIIIKTCFAFSSVDQHDPQFKVACKYENCQAMFKKWDSFRKHVYRSHQNFDDLNINELMQPDNEVINNDPGMIKIKCLSL